MLNRKLMLGNPWLAAMAFVLCGFATSSLAAPLPGGTLDVLTIPKYVTPLVIPPVMNNIDKKNGDKKIKPKDDPFTYKIAVRQFQQQILPGGIWNSLNGRTDTFNPTTVWSYGPDSDPTPTVAPDPNSQFNYPAYTIENIKDAPVTVEWINDLKDPATGEFLKHLLPIDQTLHWANPVADCIMGAPRTDCRGSSQAKYEGPVPIVTHLHGAHVGPESDGYPEAWWLPNPAGSNFLCTDDPAVAGTDDEATGFTYYMCQGKLANAYGTGYADNTNTPAGTAVYTYPNDQPSTTLWYHDHSLGMTRSNVYAGPAGFWLIREPGGGETGLNEEENILPGPAPVGKQGVLELNVPGDPVRSSIREIPIVIQDRSFNSDGSLFYPANRAFFEGLGDGDVFGGNAAAGLNIPFIDGSFDNGDPKPSDISPIWNPEAFFNVMVVNGVSWPQLEVSQAIYRFRLLNGSNSRFLNLSMFVVEDPGTDGVYGTPGDVLGVDEIPFYQIGTEQSLLPHVVRVETGYATPLPGDGNDVCVAGEEVDDCLTAQPTASDVQALLMGNAERADVLVDFSNVPDGTVIRMINTGPDEPFGGFPVDLEVIADPGTTGQVMQFKVNAGLNAMSPTDPLKKDKNGKMKPNPLAATSPTMLVMDEIDGVIGYPGNVDSFNSEAEPRDLALIEEESDYVCVSVGLDGSITYIDLGGVQFDSLDEGNACYTNGGVPFAPKEAVLGFNGNDGPPTSVYPSENTGAQVTLWSDVIVTNPELGATETWEIWNWTGDAHPIHLHLVKFKVLGRRSVTGDESIIGGDGIQPWEVGWKDTVINYPEEVTTVAATFDIAGLYVWHCHIVEHEDNEMMVPYCVGDATANGCQGL